MPGTYYTGAWSADSSSFFYTVVDACYRPCEVRRHVLGGTSGTVLAEPDRRFELTVAATRSGAYVTITAASRDTTEVWLIPAADPARAPLSVAGRRPRVEYRVDHDAGRDRLIIVTDDGFPEFKVVHAPVTGGPWQDLLPPDPAERIHRADCFAGYIVLSLRRGGEPLLRVVPLDGGEPWEIHPDTPAGRIELAHNHDYAATRILVETGSYTEPTRWEEITPATRERTTVKIAETPGYDPAEYVSERHCAPAEDGVLIPVTVVRRRDVPLDGTAPCLLYGYGAYGITIPASFSTNALSLAGRGFVYAIAHIRGGKDKGFTWYEDGKMEKKENTFRDFISAADHLVNEGFTSYENIIAEGGSAGGMLMGAIANMAPEKFAGIIAAVPFVDVLNTMLDDTLPLTPPEWPEWGNPIDSEEEYRWIAAYSPYDNVAALPYPPILAISGLTDPRVTYWEPTKWIAKLREKAPEAGPYLLKTNMAAGHGGKSGRFQRLEEIAFEYAFAIKVAGKM